MAAVFPFHNFATTNSKYFRISHAFPRLELSEGKVGRILKITFECQKGFIFSLVGGKRNEKQWKRLWGKWQWNGNVDNSIWRCFWEGNVSSFATEWISDTFFAVVSKRRQKNKQTEPKFWIFLNWCVCSALFPVCSSLYCYWSDWISLKRVTEH